MYLSWSVWQLVLVLAWLTLCYGWNVYYFRKSLKVGLIKWVTWVYGLSLVVVVFSAFNVGLEQKYINRSSFNTEPGKNIEKVESNRKTVQDVKDSFKNTIKDKE